MKAATNKDYAEELKKIEEKQKKEALQIEQQQQEL